MQFSINIPHYTPIVNLIQVTQAAKTQIRKSIETITINFLNLILFLVFSFYRTILKNLCFYDIMKIIMIKCPSCCNKNTDKSKFCRECGAGFEAGGKLQDELKLVTILFADISGFTAMSGKLSPDEVKEIIDDIIEKLTAAIESERGTVIKYEGDCIMAAFGINGSDELDPAHSCYAALKMQRELLKFSENLKRARGFGLSMRIGIHAGRCVIGLIGGRLDIMGDAVNIAARMEQNAAIGKIMITSDMAGQLKDRFLLEEPAPVKVKGKEDPVRVYNVTGKAPIRSRLILERRTEMVGREAELNSMIKKFEEVESTSIPHLFFIEGPAGCGKSRLIQEFEQYVRKLPGDIKLNRSFFNSTAGGDYRVFKVFFKTLDAGCGCESELLDHLKKAMAGYDEKILKDHSKNMSYLLGLDYSEDEYIKRMKESPKEFIPVIFKAFEDYFTAVTAETAHVFFVEDLHWADDGSIKLMDHLLRWLGGRLYFIATSRKSLDEISFKPPRLKTSGCRLNYLSAGIGDMMIKNIFNDAAGIGEDQVNKIIDKIDSVAAGNPLFIEELIISMHDKGIIVKNDAGWKIDEEKLRALSLPATVEMAIQSRIDGLSRENIEVLKKAAAIGRKFSSEALIHLLDKNLSKNFQPRISDLIKKGIFLNAGSDSYIFSHDTIRDVAYEKLTKKQKRELHEKAAGWFEGLINDRRAADENLESLICFHFDKAANKQKTVHYAQLAAGASFEKYQVEDCIHYYELIRKYLNEDENLMDEARLIEYLEGYSDVMLLAGRTNELPDILNEFEHKIQSAAAKAKLNIKKMHVYGRLSDMNNWETAINDTEKILGDPDAHKSSADDILWANLHERRGSFYETKGVWESALNCFEKTLKIYENIENKTGTAAVLISIGVIYYKMGSYDEALSRYEKSGGIYKTIGDRRGTASCLNNMGIVYSDKGDGGEALNRYGQSLNILEKTGDKRMIANCLANIGIIYHSKENYDAALDHHERSMALLKEIGDRQGIAYCLNNIGNVYQIKGNYDDALGNYIQSMAILKEIGNKYGVANCLAGIGTIYLEKGDYERALINCRQSLEILEAIGVRQGVAMCLFFIGKIHAAKGGFESALDHFNRSSAMAEENSYKPCRAMCLKETGNLYMRKTEYAEAINYYNEAITLFEELRNKTEIDSLKIKIGECIEFKAGADLLVRP